MGAHSNTNILLHIVWSTARRQPTLPAAFDIVLAAMMGEAAARVRCKLIACGVAPDHVHVVARVGSTTTAAQLVQRLKGNVAHEINERCGERVVEWQQGYWAESIAPADLGPLGKYFERQRWHHDNSHPAESWQFETT